MLAILHLFATFVAYLFKSRRRLEVEKRRVLTSYSLYYNETRTHLGLGKDAPLRRAIQRSGTIIITPILSGLHHRYARIRFREEQVYRFAGNFFLRLQPTSAFVLCCGGLLATTSTARSKRAHASGTSSTSFGSSSFAIRGPFVG
jgi:hypothetical protein